jgi:hypothetical protein
VPTIPLYNTQAAPDGWHEVRAPGGSEWWILRGVDSGTDKRVVAALFDGCTLHPQYRRMYRRYISDPTRVAPPLPSDFPCSLLAIFEHGQCRDQLLFQFPPGSLSGSSQSLDVRLGPNSVVKDSSCKLRMHVGDDSLRADVELDVSCAKASVTIWRAGQKDAEISCDGAFEHSFATTFPDAPPELDSVLRQPKIIACSAGLPAQT